MPLVLSIEYDAISDLFEATLENKARFTFSRSDINGKLESNLTLYRRAVIAALEDKPLSVGSKQKDRKELMELCAGKSVQVVGRVKRTKLSLDDLEI